MIMLFISLHRKVAKIVVLYFFEHIVNLVFEHIFNILYSVFLGKQVEKNKCSF